MLNIDGDLFHRVHYVELESGLYRIYWIILAVATVSLTIITV
jgi:hypothetical protein